MLTPEQLESLRDIGLAISAGLTTECTAAQAEDEADADISAP